jgi:aspartate carbamoyltransferase catalytic subunit
MLILEQLIYQNVKASIINAGDGAHEHPTQAFLDTILFRKWEK